MPKYFNLMHIEPNQRTISTIILLYNTSIFNNNIQCLSITMDINNIGEGSP